MSIELHVMVLGQIQNSGGVKPVNMIPDLLIMESPTAMKILTNNEAHAISP
jgi:hypothetical protein